LKLWPFELEIDRTIHWQSIYKLWSSWA
jgi:hypothetical protein